MVDVHLPADSQRRLIQIARETPEDFVRARSLPSAPLEQASNLRSPIIGKHGLQIGRKGKRGVLLPQVATERWDMKTFLEQTCVKTELPKSA
jgi:AMMECR1 domain-containing protein